MPIIAPVDSPPLALDEAFGVTVGLNDTDGALLIDGLLEVDGLIVGLPLPPLFVEGLGDGLTVGLEVGLEVGREVGLDVGRDVGLLKYKTNIEQGNVSLEKLTLQSV
jgi:hypothetical protein